MWYIVEVSKLLYKETRRQKLSVRVQKITWCLFSPLLAHICSLMYKPFREKPLMSGLIQDLYLENKVQSWWGQCSFHPDDCAVAGTERPEYQRLPTTVHTCFKMLDYNRISQEQLQGQQHAVDLQLTYGSQDVKRDGHSGHWSWGRLWPG